MHSDHSYQQLLKEILSGQSVSELSDKIGRLDPAEAADLIEALPSEDRADIWRTIQPDTRGEVLLEVRGEVKDQLIKSSSIKELVGAVRKLQIDEIADLDKKLPDKVVDAVVRLMDKQKQQRYEAVKDYPDDVAGGLMDMDAIAIRSDITIYVALRYLRLLRKKDKTMPEHLDTIYAVERDNQYVGSVPLKALVSLPLNTPIASVVNKDVDPILENTPSKEVVQIFADKDLLSAPVVDESNKLIGRITVDDILDIVRQEAEGLIMKPVGLSEKTDVFGSIFQSVKYRSVWLGVNLINAFVAALTISLFTDSIEKIVSLAILMPVVASMGGVAGNQSLMLVTRGLALDQITKENTNILLAKEIGVSVLNGFFWAIIVSVITYIWLQNLSLSLVFGGSLLFSLILSTAAGTLIPLILTKLKIDPAVGGSVILVAVSDVAGFFIFLGLATLVLLK